jgi:hypothetical protein
MVGPQHCFQLGSQVGGICAVFGSVLKLGLQTIPLQGGQEVVSYFAEVVCHRAALLTSPLYLSARFAAKSRQEFWK